MRRAAKIDRNQPEIVKALRAIGCTVAITSAVGQGFPDLVVARSRRNWLIEVKDGRLPPSARELTADQVEFHARWAGQIDVVNSVDEAITLVTEPDELKCIRDGYRLMAKQLKEAQ
jgi:Holliday junction resolvase